MFMSMYSSLFLLEKWVSFFNLTQEVSWMVDFSF